MDQTFPSDLLRSYPISLTVTVMRMAVAVMVLFQYPLQLYPSRLCAITLVRSCERWIIKSWGSGSSASIQSTVSDQLLFMIITWIFLLLSYGIAMVEVDLGIVMAIVGSTGSTMVSYILPGIIYVQLHQSCSLMKVLAYIQLMIGVIIMPVALYFVWRYNNDISQLRTNFMLDN